MTSTVEAVARVRAGWPVLTAVALLAGVTAAAIAVLSLAAALTATGLPDPGPVTTLGLPFVRAVGEVAAAVAVGGFFVAAFLVPPQDGGVLDVSGYRAVRLATAACGVWAVCAVLMVPLTVSDVSGEPLTGQLSPGAIWRAADLVDTAAAWRWTAALALVVTVAARTWLRFCTRPAVVTLMFVTGFHAVYLGGIFDAAAPDHRARLLMTTYFLVSGYLFFAVVVGVDPIPRPVGQSTAIGMVFAAILLQAVFGALLIDMTGILGQRFYRSLRLPWHTDLLGDQHLGGVIASAATALPLLLVLLALLIRGRRGRRSARDSVPADMARTDQ